MFAHPLATIAQLMKPSGGTGPSWLTVIGHTKDSLWSVDIFRCESIRLQPHWLLIILDQFRRRIIGFGSLIAMTMQRWQPTLAQRFLIAAASGLVAGESLAGVARATLSMLE